MTPKEALSNAYIIDFETRWADDYTLSKMTYEEYIRDPRFYAYGLAYKKFGDVGFPVWNPDGMLDSFFRRIDWSKTAVIVQNAVFDVSIMTWKWGVKPAFIFDTLSMARAIRGSRAGNSLKKLAADLLEKREKGDEVMLTKGLGNHLPFDIHEKLAAYCRNDVALTEEVFAVLLSQQYDLPRLFPPKELRLIDMTVRMHSEPILVLDTDLIETNLDKEAAYTKKLFDKLGIAPSELSSDAKFASILTTSYGIEPPKKVSPTTNKEAYAFAKSDTAFQQMLNSDNEALSLVCEARINAKSTQARTRGQRFYNIAQRGLLPVPIDYAKARTLRFQATAGQAINMQNLKRKGFLRRSIMAPDGHVCVVGDLSQIEPRVLAWLADYLRMLDLFRAGGDPYATFGSEMFNIPGLTKESHPDLRQSAKSALLGCGFGLGWWAFAGKTLAGFMGAPPVLYDKAFLKSMGLDRHEMQALANDEKFVKRALTVPRTVSDPEIFVHAVAAKQIIDKYRAQASAVVELWGLFDALIETSLRGGETYDYKCVQFKKGLIMLPSGMAIRFPEVHKRKLERNGIKSDTWVYNDSGEVVSFWGGAVVENVVQALARIVMTDAMLRAQDRYGYRPVMTSHDEFTIVVKEEEAETAAARVEECLTVEPKWMPGIPLASEQSFAVRYGDAK